MMSKRNYRPLEGKFSVITGASRGIGLEMAACFAEAGCALAICARTNQWQPGEEIARQHSTDVFVSQCDVRDAASVSQFFAAVK